MLAAGLRDVPGPVASSLAPDMRRSKAERRLVVALIATSVGLWGRVAVANDGGIFGYSGNPATQGGNFCALCHTGGAAPAVTLSGPTTVLGASINTYTVTIAGGQQVACGFDVSATDGFLTAIEAGTREWNGEVTHAGPRVADGNGECIYTFDWEAPFDYYPNV